MSGNKAVFLDRDGCVNVEDHYIRHIDQFRLYPDTLPSLKKLRDAGFKIVIITNQSGVARGYFSEELVHEVHNLLHEWVAEANIHIDRVEYCPHHPDGSVERYAIDCDCRKPRPGMVLRAARELSIDLSRSYIVGDKISDIALGPVVGAKSILVRTGYGEAELEKIRQGKAAAPEHVAEGIGDAVEWILRDGNAQKYG